MVVLGLRLPATFRNAAAGVGYPHDQHQVQMALNHWLAGGGGSGGYPATRKELVEQVLVHHMMVQQKVVEQVLVLVTLVSLQVLDILV